MNHWTERRLSRVAVACARLALLSAACLPAGCSLLPGRKVALDAASGFYAEAALTYRLDAGKLGQPLDVVRVEGQRVSYEQVASSPLVGESLGTLSIVYPHPSGRVGFALARFSLDSSKPQNVKPQTAAQPAAAKKSINPFAKKKATLEAPLGVASAQPEVHETWELDIAAAESEQLFKLLTNLGYYTSERPGGPAEVAVKLNGREQSKPWDQIPALNQLIQRVRAQGRLVAYVRPGGASGAGVSAIASTAAYRDLLAAQGAAGANPPANAFAFVPAQSFVPAPGFAPPVNGPPVSPVNGPAAVAVRPPANVLR